MFEITQEKTYAYCMLNESTKKKSYFETFDDLLNFLSKGEYVKRFTFNKKADSYDNLYLDNIDLTGYDRKIVFRYNTTTKTMEPESEKCIYMFFDSNDNIIDVRKYASSIRRRAQERWERIRIECLPDYTFRRGPVPGTAINYRGSMCRHPQTTQEKRKNSIPEHEKYVRAKRHHKNLVDVYDDLFVESYRNWKHKTKSRHPWAKHQKERLKRGYEKEFDNLWIEEECVDFEIDEFNND